MFDLSTRIRPVVKWAGGKSQVLEQLIPSFPMKFNRFIEPFFGGGALFLALKDSCDAVINDSNTELMNLYQVIRDNSVELMELLDELSAKYSEDFYYDLRLDVPSNLILRAARTLFLNKTGFNGLYRQNSKGQFNVPFGKREKCPALYVRENIIALSKRLKSTEIKSVDFELIIQESKEGDFIYCDPPYEPLSTTSSFNAYLASGFTQGDQRRLSMACMKAAERGVHVAISNSHTDFILDLYKDWKLENISAKRSINSKGAGRGAVKEILAISLT